MPRAVCIACGAAKRLPLRKCKRCGLRPVGDDAARSLYLSGARFDDDRERRREYEQTLESLASELRAGRPVEYDAAELARMKGLLLRSGAVQVLAALAYLFRVFLPALVFIVLLWIFVWWLEARP